MPNWPFSFVHAGDLHLDQPLYGVAEVPDHLRDLFVDAPYKAAERVFDTALAERVDFLILAGDVLHPWSSGPRGPLFLIEQFQRLRERKIPVFWAGGRVDLPELWPAGLTLPDNVHVFPAGRAASHTVDRDGQPVAVVAGASLARGSRLNTADFQADPSGLFTVGVAHVPADAAAGGQMDYWALGGCHGHMTLLGGRKTTHYAGSPQGRDSDECGPHGCTLVEVDHDGLAHLTRKTVDVVRWHAERIDLAAGAAVETVERLLAERMRSLIASTGGPDLLVNWSLSTPAPLAGRLRQGTLAEELLATLRREFGYGRPAAWSLSLDVEPTESVPAAHLKEESLLGDYLRSIRQYQADETSPLDLSPWLETGRGTSALAVNGQAGLAIWEASQDLRQRLGAVQGPDARRRVLDEALCLGLELLSGEGPKT